MTPLIVSGIVALIAIVLGVSYLSYKRGYEDAHKDQQTN